MSYGEFTNDAYTVALYKFQGNNANDSSGNGHHGTVTGATVTNFGKFGQGYSCDGSNDWIDCGSALIKNLSDFSIEVWVKFDDFSDEQHIFWEGVAGENGWGSAEECHLSSGYGTSVVYPNGITFYMGDSLITSDTNINCFTTVSPSTTDWHYIVGTIEARKYGNLYIDGDLVDSDTSSATVSVSNYDTDARIGRPGADMRYLNGVVDSLRISNIARSAKEIRNYSALTRGAYGVIMT